jgi:parallel beta-helix repeat protein
MMSTKFSCYAIVALFIFSTVAMATVQAQDAGFIEYVIKPDGSVVPDTPAITRVGTNYFLTQNITGTVIIQMDDAVFDGAGYTLRGNALKGTYNLSESSVLYLDAGFNLTRAWNVTVQNVKIENCINGITLLNSYYCRILNCSISESGVDGIKIAWSANNMVFWNYLVSNSDDGIQLINAENNRIMVNNIDSGTEYRIDGNGLQLNGNCSNNMFEGNNVTSFDTGIFVDESSGESISNIISYNNFTNNSWSGGKISGLGNVVTLNNFYNNGLLSVGDNNCSGNYWSTISSIYDYSPLTVPVDTNITPEFIALPHAEPDPTPSPTPKPTSTTQTSTPTPSASPSATEAPLASLSPTPTAKLTQASSVWAIPLLLIVTVSVVAIIFAFVVLKAQKKGKNKRLLESA